VCRLLLTLEIGGGHETLLGGYGFVVCTRCRMLDVHGQPLICLSYVCCTARDLQPPLKAADWRQTMHAPKTTRKTMRSVQT
jgi:hypothetical protein